MKTCKCGKNAWYSGVASCTLAVGGLGAPSALLVCCRGRRHVVSHTSLASYS